MNFNHGGKKNSVILQQQSRKAQNPYLSRIDDKAMTDLSKVKKCIDRIYGDNDCSKIAGIMALWPMYNYWVR